LSIEKESLEETSGKKLREELMIFLGAIFYPKDMKEALDKSDFDR
jgi:hypothetical protein